MKTEIVGDGPGVIRSRMTYNYAVICIDHTILICIEIFWIPYCFRAIHCYVSCSVRRSKNADHLHHVNTVNGFSHSQNTMIDIECRRNEQLGLSTCEGYYFICVVTDVGRSAPLEFANS